MFSGGSQSGLGGETVLVHPGEDPTAKEDEEWWTATLNLLDQSEAGALFRGEVPASYAKFKLKTLHAEDVINTVPALTASGDNAALRAAIIKENARVQALKDENDARSAQRTAYDTQIKRAVASWLDSAMRQKSEVRLRALQAAHKLGTSEGSY